ncbi:MAG: hypothetical protein ABJC74_07755 [Gemmatimonadota bacterium]
MHDNKRLAAFGILVSVGLAACGGGSSAPATDTTMDATEATQIGTTASTVISGAANSLGQFILDDGTLTDPTLAPGVASRHRTTLASLLAFGAKGHADLSPAAVDGGIANCHPTQSDTADTDADGIFNDNTLTFTAANCSYVNGFGVAVTVTGSVRIREAGTLYGFQVDFNALKYNLVGTVGSGTLTISGNYSASVTGQGATIAENLQAHTAAGTGPGATGSTNWILTFTPALEIPANATRLPAGDFSISGTASYSRQGHTWAITLITAQPLTYDGECQSDPPFGAGLLEGQITTARTHGFSVQYTGCGAAPTYLALGAS